MNEFEARDLGNASSRQSTSLIVHSDSPTTTSLDPAEAAATLFVLDRNLPFSVLHPLLPLHLVLDPLHRIRHFLSHSTSSNSITGSRRSSRR